MTKRKWKRIGCVLRNGKRENIAIISGNEGAFMTSGRPGEIQQQRLSNEVDESGMLTYRQGTPCKTFSLFKHLSIEINSEEISIFLQKCRKFKFHFTLRNEVLNNLPGNCFHSDRLYVSLASHFTPRAIHSIEEKQMLNFSISFPPKINFEFEYFSKKNGKILTIIHDNMRRRSKSRKIG